ncbi:MAG: GAF domain-containing protein, partial [Chitinivibrionales bacterium]|nr:GAF domain-containing protein [Chitinivibrionales bacterium]
SIKTIHELVVLNITNIIKAQSVVIYQFHDDKAINLTRCRDGVLYHEKESLVPCSACKVILAHGRSSQITGNLTREFSDSCCFASSDYRSYIGIPIRSYSSNPVGMICVMRREEKPFYEYEIHLIEIFARYIAYEISRRRMERQMLQSREMKLLGQLTSGVAHEVRNPLNALMALSEALFKRIGDDSEYEQYMKHIKNQIDRLSTLMEDLLALGRPLRKDDLHEVSVSNLLSDAVTNWQQVALERNERVKMMAIPRSEDIKVNVDTTKLQQVFLNLLDNAEQHMNDDGAITIKVSDKDEHYVRIQFCDTGSGIGQKDLQHVFDPFFTTRKGGTGLGLSIVKNTVEHHGGKISLFNNDPQPGLTVEISLPVSAG